MSALLLSYQLSTRPQPLQTSTVTTAASGTIDVYVSEGTTIAYADSITVAVQVGTDPGAVFAQPPVAAVNTGKWTITSALVDGRTIGLNAASYAQFIFTAQSKDDYRIAYNLVFSLSGAVVGTPGLGNLGIIEHAGTVNDPTKFTDNTGMFQLQLALPQLYLQSFVAAAKGAPTVPVTEFALGAEIDLAWESNGSWFQLFKKGDAAPVYSGTASAYALSGGLGTDTTFIVTASMSGDPSQDGSFQPIVLYDALTVTISNPALTPSTVKTSGDVNVGGALAVAGTTALTGNATLGNATLGSATVGGTLTANGATTLSSATVTQSLTSSGSTALAAASVSGLLTVFGGLTATAGAASLFSGVTPLTQGTKYLANTDGLVICGISPPSGSVRGYTTVTGATDDGLSVSTTSSLLDASFGVSASWGNFTMPVRKGTHFWTSPSIPFGWTVTLWWMALGSAPSGAPFERVGDLAPEDESPASHPRAAIHPPEG
jgi:hypothetical protein